VKIKLHVDHDGRQVWTRNDAEKKQSWRENFWALKVILWESVQKTSFEIWQLSRYKLSLHFSRLREMCVFGR